MVDVLKQLDDQVRARISLDSSETDSPVRRVVGALSHIRAFPFLPDRPPERRRLESRDQVPPRYERRERARRRRGDDAPCASSSPRAGSPRAPRRGVIDLSAPPPGAHPAACASSPRSSPNSLYVRAAVDSGDAANTGAAGDVSSCLDAPHAAPSGARAPRRRRPHRLPTPRVPRRAVHGARKRAVACLAALAANVSDAGLSPTPPRPNSPARRPRLNKPTAGVTCLCTPTSRRVREIRGATIRTARGRGDAVPAGAVRVGEEAAGGRECRAMELLRR